MRYYFHLRGAVEGQDDEGEILADDKAARREATLLFAELLRDRPDDFWSVGGLEVTVTDATGRRLAELVGAGRLLGSGPT